MITSNKARYWASVMRVWPRARKRETPNCWQSRRSHRPGSETSTCIRAATSLGVSKVSTSLPFDPLCVATVGAFFIADSHTNPIEPDMAHKYTREHNVATPIEV